MSNKKALISLLSVQNGSVKDKWRQLDEAGLSQLKKDAEALGRRERVYLGLKVLASPAPALMLYAAVAHFHGQDWLFGLVCFLIALVSMAVVLDHGEKAARPLQDLQFFLRSLAEPQYADTCTQMLTFAKEAPGCEAYRRDVLSKGRGFLMADFYVMRRLYQEGGSGKGQPPYRVLSQTDLDACIAGL